MAEGQFGVGGLHLRYYSGENAALPGGDFLPTLPKGVFGEEHVGEGIGELVVIIVGGSDPFAHFFSDGGCAQGNHSFGRGHIGDDGEVSLLTEVLTGLPILAHLR